MTLIDEETEAPAVPEVEITGPGVYDMPADQYHRRPELSSSGMRKLLAPGCPYLYHWEQLNPPEPKDEFDFGHVAHKLVLGEGEQVQVLDFDSYRTADARAAKLQAYAQGMIPILEREFLKAKAMALEVRKHPVAKALLQQGGKPEQSLFWRDAATGVDMKARVDWLDPREGRRLKVVDYKTAAKVDEESIRRAIADHGYHQQGATYAEACQALGLGDGDDTVVNLIFQEKTIPFLVHVVQLTPYDLQLGAARNRAAIRIYRECMESGEWPGYPEVSHIEMSAWAQNRDRDWYMS